MNQNERTNMLTPFEKAFADAVFLQLVEEKIITKLQFEKIKTHENNFKTKTETDSQQHAKRRIIN